MKFVTLFAGALAATTAANILLASDAHALPNGWTQVGQSCKVYHTTGDKGTQTYTKLVKVGSSTSYGVWKSSDGWEQKDISKAAANAKMNSKCDTNSYQN